MNGEHDPKIEALEARIRQLEEQLAQLTSSQDKLARTFERQSNAFGPRAYQRLSRKVASQAALAHSTSTQLHDLLNSRIWQTLSAAGGLVLRVTQGRRIARPPANGHQGVSGTRPITIEEYHQWIHTVEIEEAAWSELKLDGLRERPLVSVVMPVCDPDPGHLERAIASVFRQIYTHWELCIADDASGAGILKILERFAAAEPSVRLAVRSRRGGISEATNTALEMASGEFVAFLDHDDELSRDALLYSADALLSDPTAPFVYSDEDKLDPVGRRCDPFFKPGWSPDLILSENYVCHFLVARRSLVEKVGRLRSQFDGSQDHDLVLRLADCGGTPAHVSRVLYHWRMGEGSAAARHDAKEYALNAGRAAIADFVSRKAPGATVEPGTRPGRWRVRYPISPALEVSIIIPSGGKAEMLRQNIETIKAKTGEIPYEILVADNSTGEAIAKLVEDFRRRGMKLRHFDWRHKPFNFSTINNQAAAQCSSPLLLFLNDDTTVMESGWLVALAELAARPEVGAVGARLLYPSGIIQHAGVVMGVFDNCGHAFKGLDGSQPHYFDFPDVIRNVSAVTGACLMTRAAVFQEVGGFDERTFAVAFNDIDLCLRIGARGYRVLYTPHAVLYHHEAFSKSREDLVPHPAEVAAMRRKWKDVIESDPFYNRHLTRVTEDYALEAPGVDS